MLPALVILDAKLTAGLPARADRGHRAWTRCRTTLKPSSPPSSIRWPPASRWEGMRIVQEKPAPRRGRRAETWRPAPRCWRPHPWERPPSSRGLGAMHALAHPAGRAGTTRTTACLNACADALCAGLANRAAIGDSHRRRWRVTSVCLRPSFESFLDWVLRLRQEHLGIPHTLTAIGTTRGQAGRHRRDGPWPMARTAPTRSTSPVAAKYNTRIFYRRGGWPPIAPPEPASPWPGSCIAGLQHETNTFSVTAGATFLDFVQADAWPGLLVALVDRPSALGGRNIPGGRHDTPAAKAGHEPVPLMWANASPSGPGDAGRVRGPRGGCSSARSTKPPPPSTRCCSTCTARWSPRISTPASENSGPRCAASPSSGPRCRWSRCSTSTPTSTKLGRLAGRPGPLVYRTYPHVDSADCGRARRRPAAAPARWRAPAQGIPAARFPHPDAGPVHAGRAVCGLMRALARENEASG